MPSPGGGGDHQSLKGQQQQSLLLAPGCIDGIDGIVTSFKLLWQHYEPLPLLGIFLVLCSALLTTLSTESVGMYPYGKCRDHIPFPIFIAGYCPISLTVVEMTAKITEGLLVIMCLLAFLGIILYYEATARNAPLDRFMNNESFGARFIFTSFGVTIAFFWG
ncbi:hypothetical protein B0T26DRAFT_755553 [Lasiosphaeria miniovina]|uniref:Uncharacterized protein n=1 Tax=Lasiosphaeria miniovina TaxID=1954250 RepID=A0AA40DK12_9PEZI|nr:uncharacterized protein B0T26DRAFT_755553 [Lasiosphaeria miniovina]KAK0706010.1 hypothetical protein B0T26DRAFT_755553 [Lasiosphaeria miniovina]